MKAVATLAAGLAHEIKNPLASIRTFTEYLDSRYDDAEFRLKFQKIVGGEVERINLIVQQLLEFAKPVPPKLRPLEIPTLVDETLEFLSGDLVERHVEVNRRYGTTACILGDPQQLKQVFLNLFLNSLQAMNGHGRLEIRTTIEGSDLAVSIADSGAGIAPKDLPHIFEPFYTTKETGTGLGLAVVQGIVKEHGGRITVESQPGRGTVLTLYLPVAV
jgi:two-component system sensor histidine kinase HydH